MLTNIALRKAAGAWLAAVAALGFCLLTLAIPAGAKEPVTGQHPGTLHPWPTAQSAHSVIPDRDWDGPTLSRPAFPVAPMCGANALFADPFAPSSPWMQRSVYAWPNSPTQGMLGAPDVMAWFGYNNGLMGWSNPYLNQSVAPNPCGSGFWVQMP